MSEIEKKWYVLRAVSGKESKVKEYLDADIKNSDLSEYVSQVLIPTEKVYQVRNGKKIVKERSYLPGYVLVEAALVGEVAHHLRNTPNVIGFLGGSENPVPLRQSEVNRILPAAVLKAVSLLCLSCVQVWALWRAYSVLFPKLMLVISA